MACPDANVVGALLADELSSGERAAVVDHAGSCALCRAMLGVLFDAGTQPSRGASTGLLEVGARVGRYVIAERLGAGGMGVVHAATDTELHRRVAVKLLRPGHDGEFDSQGRERLLREARTLARLSHPNVVTVFDVGVHGDHLFVAMELVEGGSLTAWLARKPRTLGEIVDRMCEAGRGLAAAHAAGVIHRDVKPDNILVGEDGRARVTDFGLARSTGDVPGRITGALPEAPLTMTHAVVGTPVYMAPEQLDGKRVDERSDQWSFCATLYEAVAGVRPFSASDVDTRRSAIAGGRIAEPATGRSVPGWLRRIVLRGMRADPAERWPSVGAIVDALVRGRGRRRRIALASVALALVAGVGLTFALTRHAPEDISRRFFVEKDFRTGCSCPYSACDEHGRCLSECNARTYKLGTPVPGLGAIGRQKALLGATPDADIVFFVSGRSCGIDRLLVARRHPDGVYAPHDITDRVRERVPNVEVTEACCAIAGDGRSLVVRTSDVHRFTRVALSELDEVGPADDHEFADLTPPLTGKEHVRHPVMTADQRTLYYSVFDWAADGDRGPLYGVYVSERADVGQPFPRGKRIPGNARDYGYVTGVTADNLTLFMTSEFSTRVLMRSSTSEVFGNPAPAVGTPILYGWRTIALRGCHQLLSTQTPGGCASEEIVTLDPME